MQFLLDSEEVRNSIGPKIHPLSKQEPQQLTAVTLSVSFVGRSGVFRRAGEGHCPVAFLLLWHQT